MELQANVFSKATLHLLDMGFIGEDGKKVTSILLSPFLLIGLFMKIGLIGEMYKDYSRHSTTELFNSLVFLISLTFQTTVSVTFYLGGMTVPKFVKKITTHKYGVSQNFSSLVKKVDKRTNAIYNYIVYGYILFALLNHASYEECSRTKKEEENTSLYYCGVYSTTWYPIYLDFTPVKQILYIFQVAELVYYIPKISTALVFLHGSIELIEHRIADLKCFLKDTVVTTTNVEEVNKRLKYAVMKYIEISESVESMNSTIGFIFSPVQQTVILGLLVFLEFRIVLERNMESIPLIIFWSSFELLICWKGQCLENASESLANDVYEFPWYDLHPSSMSLFKLFYSQVQPTLKFQSRPFICYNMRYYYEVMKGSYSLLMYLRRF